MNQDEIFQTTFSADISHQISSNSVHCFRSWNGCM